MTGELDSWPEILVVFDGENGSASRQASDAADKANRDSSDAVRPPMEALAGITISLDLFGISWIELEADDVIAALTTAAHAERDVLILSADQDFYQLLSDPDATHRSIRVLNTAQRPGSRFIGPGDLLPPTTASPRPSPLTSALCPETAATTSPASAVSVPSPPPLCSPAV